MKDESEVMYDCSILYLRFLFVLGVATLLVGATNGKYLHNYMIANHLIGLITHIHCLLNSLWFTSVNKPGKIAQQLYA